MNQNEKAINATKVVAFGGIYEKYLSDNALKTVNKLTYDVNQAYIQGTPHAEAAIIAMEEAKQHFEEKNKKKENISVRTRKLGDHAAGVAGFINASILIYFILIFGVLIALSLIIFLF